jgi:putative hemolysin
MPIQDLFAERSRTGSSAQGPDLFPFGRLGRRTTPMDRIRELYRRAQQPVNRPILDNVLAEMRVHYHASQSDLARIPTAGPVVVTANHPFGLLDGAILGSLLSQVRPDVKILTNFLLAGIPELHEHCIFVDPFGAKDSAFRNRTGIKQAIEWLANGGMLATFPAGEVSHIRVRHFDIADPEWNVIAARFARKTGAAVLPVYFPGCNSAMFQTLGLLHPQLRTARLINEFLQQTDKKIEVRIGSLVPARAIRDIASDREAADYLRWRTYILSQRGERRRKPILPAIRINSVPAAHEAVAPPLSPELLLADVERLGAGNCLHETPEFVAYLAEAAEIPSLLQEIGRLREITFREVGEGTGRAIDLDGFDQHYKHILLWSKTRRELVGAYRLGTTTEILPRQGVRGFYTNTLFRFQPELFDQLGPAVELGRSFVRPEYQREYAPLLTLWKGIGRYLARNPQFATLFGAVSISNRYSRWSRELIFRFYQSGRPGQDFSRFISPRNPFRERWIRPGDGAALSSRFSDLEQLSDPIFDVEGDGKTIPILLKHYARLGGRLVAFNVDREFSDVLDGLVFVDLRRSDPAVLRRYLGDDGMDAFRRYHGVAEESRKA